MNFYINLTFTLINILMFHLTGNKMNLLFAFILAFALTLSYISTPEKDEEE